MSARGLNAVRTYTVPPRRLLDLAYKHGLYVMAGLPWEQHVAFLDSWKQVRSIHARVREGVRSVAGNPALLCIAVGNEIPSSIVRWHGPRRIQRHLRRLCETAKSEDPEALVTYVNYPTTEYLELPFLDLMCFNVFLEARPDLASYLARLQNIAADRPLIMTEIGLDSRSHGHDRQSEVLSWQVDTVFRGGAAGMFVFSWTDEWHRGGHDIEDWDFGLTKRDRTPKPALASVQKAYAEAAFPAGRRWPKITVVVCSYNGRATIGECVEHLRKLQYPNFEIIVIDDGSTNGVSELAQRSGASCVIRVPNGGCRGPATWASKRRVAR